MTTERGPGLPTDDEIQRAFRDLAGNGRVPDPRATLDVERGDDTTTLVSTLGAIRQGLGVRHSEPFLDPRTRARVPVAPATLRARILASARSLGLACADTHAPGRRTTQAGQRDPRHGRQET